MSISSIKNLGSAWGKPFFTPVLILAQLFAAPAIACSFHVNLPELSVGDRIIQASHIVLAREDRDKPFTFDPVISLKGDSENLDIPLLVDSATRRRLAANSGDFVLISKSSMDDKWHRLAYVRDQDQELFRDMVTAAKTWSGTQDTSSRFDFFAALHDHPQTTLRKIALTELDKIPYQHLRTMPVRLSAAHINNKLSSRYEIPWVPIRIIMLGILGDEESRAIIGKSIAYIENSGFQSNLGAWATAYIEIDGPDAVDKLTQKFLLNGTTKSKSVEELLTAFSLHGSVDNPELKLSIDANLEKMVATSPQMAVSIAKIFGAQQDYSKSDLLLKTMKSGALRTPSELLVVASYLSLAQKSRQSTQ
ncbi:MAG: hypothetical protein AAF362_09080 [Pseudomonadota bacterium]